jgi:hypothetical protein
MKYGRKFSGTSPQSIAVMRGKLQQAVFFIPAKQHNSSSTTSLYRQSFLIWMWYNLARPDRRKATLTPAS